MSDNTARQSARLPHSLGRLVSVIHRLKTRYLDEQLRPLGLNGGIYLYLAFLRTGGGSRQDDMSRRLHLDKGTVARGLNKLEQLGYVVRQADPLDRRARRVYLTERGRQLLPRLKGVLCRTTELLGDGLDAAQRRQALELLRIMSENMARHLGRRTD